MGNHAHTATHGVQLRMKGLMQPLVGPEPVNFSVYGG